MSTIFLRLGDVALQAHEIAHPIVVEQESIRDAQVEVGERGIAETHITDVLQLQWQGKLRGSTAHSRAISLRTLAQAGAYVPLDHVGVQVGWVRLSRFEADISRSGDINYQIQCVCEGQSDIAKPAARGTLATASHAQRSLIDLVRVLARQAVREHSDKPSKSRSKEQG